MRSFLDEISLRRVREPVSPRFGISQHLSEEFPVLFEKVDGYPIFRVAGNLCNSRDTFARILRTTRARILSAFSEALDSPSDYGMVNSASFLKNRVRDPDLTEELPLCVYFGPEERYYSTASIVLARDPETGRENASFHRMMHISGNRMVIRIVPRDLYSFFKKNQDHGDDTEIVIICGVHPAVSMAAATSYPNLNELRLANTIMQGGLRCHSLAGIDVPSHTEVVMTGRILHDEEVEEGPFVDLTGTWDAVRQQPVVEVDTLYHRDNPIWQVILPAGKEHRLLMGIPQEPRIFRIVQNAVPTVTNVTLPPAGLSWLHAVVSIKKRAEGEGGNAALAALSAHPSLKRVIVVDDDIDIFDPDMVEWAVATRLRPGKGITVIPDTRGSSLDPSSGKSGLVSKWFIDATIPLDADPGKFMRVDASHTPAEKES